MIVYLARNRANGKAYVGKTMRSLEQRWQEHVRNAQVNKDEMPLYFAIRKHGSGGFELRVLQECADEDELNEAEISWIEAFGSFSRGYNATRGGDGISGYRHTPETKQRMSKYRKGRKLGPKSEEAKRRISEGRKGLGIGPRPHAQGWNHGEEACEKISEALRNRVRSTRAVIQYDMIGNVMATYPSMKDASVAVNGHKDRIGDCCRGNRESHAGYKWAYAVSLNIVKE